MRNEKGSALAIVMLVLGVASLIGVALITQTNLDLQLTSSVQIYNRIFSAADGAVAVAFNDLRTQDRQDTGQFDPAQKPSWDVLTTSEHDLSWSSKVTLMGPCAAGGSPLVAGYGEDFYQLCWRGEGKGSRSQAFIWGGGSKTGGTDAQIHVAVTKIARKQ
jgi:hypothetical protein